MNEILQDVKAFKNVSSYTFQKLNDFAMMRRFKKGEHLFLDKDYLDYMYIVKSGFVSIYKVNVQHEKKVIFIFGKGELINEDILNNLPVSVNCEIFEDAEILCIPKQIILELAETDFNVMRGIGDSLSLKLRRTYRQLKNTSTSVKVEKRVIAKLWKLATDRGVLCEDGICIDMNLSITYLADMLGITRESASRQIKILIEMELIKLHKNKFIVRDLDKLSNYFKKN